MLDRSRIAVIGAGISGLTAARILAGRHDVTVFEANRWTGGHTHTHDVELAGRSWAVDTGFIVYNDRAYPNFVRMLAALGVATRPASMSFGVRCERTGLEYGGENLNGVFAQRRNLFRPSFWRLMRDILRFGREAKELLLPGDEGLGLSEYLDRRGYSRRFIDHYAVPIGSAIWSASPSAMTEFPARHFVRFFDHHGVLDVRHPPQWRTIVGGSRAYVEKLTAPIRARIRTGTEVERVARSAGAVSVRTADGAESSFDRVVIATHSDQALALLETPTRAEREVLSAIPYQTNEVLLHADTRLMPRSRRAWASWNYLVPRESRERPLVTYYMNRLQAIPCPVPLLVSLNADSQVDPARVIQRMTYDHPRYTPAALDAQRRHTEIDGKDRIHYCGAYWGYGFHEDGVVSALRVTRAFGLGLEAIA